MGKERRSFFPRLCRLLNPSSSSRRSIKSITRDSGIPSSSKVCGTRGVNVRKSRTFVTGKADIVYEPSQSGYRRVGGLSLESTGALLFQIRRACRQSVLRLLAEGLGLDYFGGRNRTHTLAGKLTHTLFLVETLGFGAGMLRAGHCSGGTAS